MRRRGKERGTLHQHKSRVRRGVGNRSRGGGRSGGEEGGGVRGVGGAEEERCPHGHRRVRVEMTLPTSLFFIKKTTHPTTHSNEISKKQNEFSGRREKLM
jgi:hypothetical protein